MVREDWLLPSRRLVKGKPDSGAAEAWPLATVPCMCRGELFVMLSPRHLHMVDLSCTGPSFERLSKKMLLLDDVIQAFEAEVAEGIGEP